MARKIPRQWVNMQTGELTMEALQYLDDLENGKDADSPSINTLLSGVNAVTTTTDGIVAGTVPLTDVLITGVGSVTGALDTQASNITSASQAASAGALTATVNSYSASGERAGPGSVTTDPATVVTASGGTSPYTYAWANVEGDAATVNSPTAATTTFTHSLTLVAPTKSGVYECTVTDNVAATFRVYVNVSAFST
jgi:hypothetical protein